MKIDDIPMSLLLDIHELLLDVTDEMVDAGYYYNHKHNSASNMSGSYRAMIETHPMFSKIYK